MRIIYTLLDKNYSRQSTSVLICLNKIDYQLTPISEIICFVGGEVLREKTGNPTGNKSHRLSEDRNETWQA
jgi:hypothetical protein